MHRRKPFSGKKKKEQLQQKKSSKSSKNSDAALVSVFDKEKGELIQERKVKCQEPIKRTENNIVSFEDFYPDAKCYAIPLKPSWDYSMTKEELERSEESMFKEWLERIDSLNLSCYYEKNLQVWRQLWRVVELSDIILCVIDIRHPILHFPPSIYEYVVKNMKKSMVAVFMKVDLVSKGTLEAWTSYFKAHFPSLLFCSCSIYDINERSAPKKKRYEKAFGIRDLISQLSVLSTNKKVDWDQVLLKIDNNESRTVDEPIIDREMLTLGFIGHPNAGKSSLINSIMGRKVVSASKSPGHTKHFQTIHVTPTFRLCDCPGLIFPSTVTKQMQIVSGIYPVSQIRDPIYNVKYLAERLELEKILKLKLPEDCQEWSAWAICEAFALDKGFITAKAARPDVNRAANLILRLVSDGRILLSFKPPNYSATEHESTQPSYSYLSESENSTDLSDTVENVNVAFNSFDLLEEE